MSPDGPSAASQRQQHRNARGRGAFLIEFPALTADQVGLHGRERLSPAELVGDRSEPFAVEQTGRRLYPAFQFDDGGRVKASVRDALRALPPELVEGGWQLALWWVIPAARLGGQRPVDILDGDPTAVSRQR